ncbi:E3 ubiquitin-protein ligase ZFP91-like [Dreissena polymorpha]|uniref:E3 ubiquitin-protein ligase ZFP91-like n=1 Tax=Dreissena polymorpha TaxID=45954 RepID=UPI00226556AC|nr:E3 ubiquitin-protein ligase ZFP91-like [Dreissena polymorpha]XP_052249232.1 E3 ubiquitin-protein ligase ZFP91-like [Dreissena polymorpha]
METVTAGNHERDLKPPALQNAAVDEEDTSEFIEFEFSPNNSPSKERSVSPDPEEVLDNIYEAAIHGDSTSVCDLIYNFPSKGKSKDFSDASRDENKKFRKIENLTEVLKRKTIEEAANTPAAKKVCVAEDKAVSFTNIVNIQQKPTAENGANQEKRILGPAQKKRSLIDYSVLTKALSTTLESKLAEDENNDVKIVIFCNNKPIQSFSVKSNKKDKSGSSAGSISLTEKTSNGPAEGGNSSKAVSGIQISLPSGLIVTNSQISGNNLLVRGSKQGSELKPAAANTVVLTQSTILARTGLSQDKPVRFTLAPSQAPVPATQSYVSLLVPNSLKPATKPVNVTVQPPKDSVNNLHETGVSDSENNNDVPEDSSGPVTCELCNRSFKLRRYLNRHKIRVHRKVSDVEAELNDASDHSVESTPVKINDSSVVEEVKDKDPQIDDSSESHEQEDVDIENSDSESKLEIDEGEIKKDGTHREVKKKIKASGEGIEDDIDIERVKRETSVDSFEENINEYISTILKDSDILCEEVKYADKGKRALFHATTELNGRRARDLLNQVGALPKPVTGVVRTENGFPLTSEGLIEPVYVCEQCGKFYRARKTLKDHFFREHARSRDEEPLYLYISGNKYQCPICFSHFHSGSELVSHTKKHTGELQSECKLCGKIYSSVHVLRRHIENVHAETKPRPFQCELCDYAATNKWHLKEHYRRHTGEQPFECPICQKTFSHQGTMNRHCKIIHKFEVSSQRQFSRNTISDLPVIPEPFNSAGKSSPRDRPKTAPRTKHLNRMPKKMTVLRVKAPVINSIKSIPSHDTDVDLSLVKSEPVE